MNNTSVVTYTLDKCTKCLKCLKACPTEAIKIIDNRVLIDDKCINCGKCIKACHFQGLKAKGSTLIDIENYDYTVALIPSAMIGECRDYKEVEQLFKAILSLGFDEVKDLSSIEGQLEAEARNYALKKENNSMITSFCPVINNLIKVKYPSLLNSIVPLNLPSEILAKKIKEEYAAKGKVGVFNLCECISKLAYAKYPYGNKNSNIDHALAIVDIFAAIKSNLNEETSECNLCLEGLFSVSPSTMTHDSKYVVADGFDKINEILQLAEFGQLNKFDLLALFPCNNGCFGGGLLWGNSFNAINNIRNLYKEANKEISTYLWDDIYLPILPGNKKDLKTIKEKLEFFEKVNEQLEKLPSYDCGACGMATCSIMAEEIVKGNKRLTDCEILRRVKDDGKRFVKLE